MWVSQKAKWNTKTSCYERFFIEKMIQKCDFDESISKRHKTTNGYVQVKEMLRLIELSENRGKSIKTLIVLGEEARSPLFKQNILNDFIVLKYFDDLKLFIDRFEFESLVSSGVPNLIKLKEFKHQLQKFDIQLEKYYYQSLIKEFNELNFDTSKFERNAKLIDKLTEIYATFLIFKGYSASTITSFLSSQLSKTKHVSFKSFTKVFNFKSKNSRHYLALEDINDDISDFAELMTSDYDVKVFEKGQSPEVDQILKGKPYLTFTNKSMDVNSFIRSLYDKLLKKLVVKKDRQSLNSFNAFFNLAYWSHLSSHNLKKNELKGDPINVSMRERTLLKTLDKLNIIDSVDRNEMPEISSTKLYNSIYYYNLALGSKSIENSLALLWTALESSIPYRTANSDVICVRNIIAKVLSLGCVCRDIHALSCRFTTSYKLNTELLSGTGLSKMKNPSKNEDLKEWSYWLSQNKPKRFDKVIEASDLLAFEYSKYGQFMSNGTADDLLKRIEGSKNSLDYQIQRIYIHRNQIIHAGDFINEYTNLWMNTEWYTGKLLAFMIQNELKKECVVRAVKNLESDYDYLVSYLSKNKKMPISELPERINDIFLNQYWQSF